MSFFADPNLRTPQNRNSDKPANHQLLPVVAKREAALIDKPRIRIQNIPAAILRTMLREAPHNDHPDHRLILALPAAFIAPLIPLSRIKATLNPAEPKALLFIDPDRSPRLVRPVIDRLPNARRRTLAAPGRQNKQRRGGNPQNALKEGSRHCSYFNERKLCR